MGNKLKILIPSGVVILLLLLFGAVSMSVTRDDGKILNGIYINEENVGGLTKDDAAKLIEEKFISNVQNKKIQLNYNDRHYTIGYKELKAGYKISSVIDDAYNFGKDGNIFSKLADRWSLKNSIHNFKLEFTSDTSSVDSIIKKISSEINVEPKDAAVSFNGSNFTTTADVVGLKVNEAKLKQLINASVNPELKDEKIEIPVEKTEAKVTQVQLKKIDTKISGFTTSFNPKDANRTGNLRIASQAVNGKVIMPGEVFSMNKALGPRVASKGYTEAPIIVKNTVVPSLAGGICQVTTTIYNAALLANFQIVERRNHGLLVSYVGAGRDATISGDAIDMKFKNTNSSPIYIQIIMGKSSLTVNFYSANEHPNQRVEITSEVLERIAAKTEYIDDPALPAGSKVVDQKPIGGAKSKTYRKVYQDGVLVKTELLSKDTYNTADGIIRVGPKISVPVTPVPTAVPTVAPTVVPTVIPTLTPVPPVEGTVQ